MFARAHPLLDGDPSSFACASGHGGNVIRDDSLLRRDLPCIA
jgi:hypothetical protein